MFIGFSVTWKIDALDMDISHGSCFTALISSN